MCGHVGIAGKLTHPDEATLKRMLIFDYFRGPDSTGFAALRKTGEVKTVKIASHPLDLFDMKRFTDALAFYPSSVFLGHNRFATKGKVNNSNAHPYTFDHIVGAHNGTLDVTSWRALEEKLGEKFDVDSMAIIACIAKFGIDATIPLLEGAWAIVWIDTTDNTLNFIRNKERPLWYAYSADFTKLFWASEHHIIAAAVGMSTSEYDLYSDVKDFTYFQAKEDWHYRFDLSKLIEDDKILPKPRVKILKGKEPTPVERYAGTHSPFQRDTGPATFTTGTTTTTGSVTLVPSTTSHEKVNGNVVLLSFKGSQVKPLGDFVDKEEFEELAKYGCSWCQTDVEFGEPGVTVFKSRSAVICPDCSGDKKSRIYLDSDDVKKHNLQQS